MYVICISFKLIKWIICFIILFEKNPVGEEWKKNRGMKKSRGMEIFRNIRKPHGFLKMVGPKLFNAEKSVFHKGMKVVKYLNPCFSYRNVIVPFKRREEWYCWREQWHIVKSKCSVIFISVLNFCYFNLSFWRITLFVFYIRLYIV